MWAAFLVWHGMTTISRADDPRAAYVPTSAYVERQVEGWTVRVNRRLIDGDNAALGRRALELLGEKLAEVRRAVPTPAVKRLQAVPIWLGVDDGHAPCAEYHPSRTWLVDNGYNPDKAKCVEIGNATRFVEWSNDQPSMVLHELAHAYHDQALGDLAEVIRTAYERAKGSGRYEAVRRVNGRTERAYALVDPQEFFAELSEAYFGHNDFEPFDRDALRKFDPQSLEMLEAAWGIMH